MNQRYYSLDVFRGATVALMILVNNPGSWSYAFSPLKHAPWHGCTPTDLVFPFFLFAVGNAMAFVMPKLQVQGPNLFWKKVLKRTALIFLIGLLLNWYPFVQWSNEALSLKYWVNPTNPASGIRILGVLQRIALCYLFASILVYFFKTKTIIYLSASVLVLYWLACVIFGSHDPYSLQGWFGTKVDMAVLHTPHMYKGEGVPFDPEGLASTFTAVIQVVVGFLVGKYIRQGGETGEDQRPVYRTISALMVVAAILTLAGLTWGLAFPINKKIWTSSFVLYTSGLAITTLSVLIWFLEVKGVKNSVTKFFDVFGKNPLFIFVMSALIPKTLSLIRIEHGFDEAGKPSYTSPLGWFYSAICAKFPGPPEVGSFIYAICFLSLLWIICYVMDRKKIYVKV
ncbi:acyltransferase family protein [Olivibacter sp. XZL3]|uniref:acyltransferase family protein n=1 Tax=Olivibacter sp. XZL3 TaxID=1735116 RepID=UPI001065F14B|nr:heparan-alpha-glucosaminide N-acetyltransferase domain-containing protein [Olivibacter sp. XZL3]